jgi:eukaryotic-like serine/threonine-protein kinase
MGPAHASVRLVARAGRMSAVSSTGERVVAGRYRLRRRLGQGAMGIVWEAFDEWLRRPVAVKEVLLPPGMPDLQAAELRERTLREARAIAALSHPNVITLHDVAREDGEPFVVMEFVHAHSLAAVIDVLGPLPTPKAAAIADAVAAGLAAAHQVGITHRDVKPGNVLIGVDGRVKLTDFGIARNVAERTLTSTGIMLGSPAYIAPEVAAGREVTSAADVWSLGATLFAVIEGRPPYDVNGAVLATVNQVVHGDVPRLTTGGPMDAIVAALMVKEPADRISLRELRDRLHPLLPPSHTELLSDEELAQVNAAVEASAPPVEQETDSGADKDPPPLAADPGPVPGSTPLAAAPGPVPGSTPAVDSAPPAKPLAPTPGPLPFDATTRPKPKRSRGSLATGLVAFLAVLLFFAASAGGFALARYVADKPLLPPSKSVVQQPPSSTSSSAPDPLRTRSGNATTVKGEQGGGYSLPVPLDWVEFVEEIRDEKYVDSTHVYYLSPDGTQSLTVERLARFYEIPGRYNIDTYLGRLAQQSPDVRIDRVSDTATKGFETNGGPPPPEPAREVVYRSTANAQVLVPNDPGALDQNRVTYARLIPYAGDLWVVSVTVPIEQEDSGDRLFDRIAPDFQVTG